LAKELATHPDDPRLNDFQTISDAKKIVIGVGIPLKKDPGISISMIIFQPHQKKHIYSKRYLHPDEEEFFISEQNTVGLIGNEKKIALAICYELSIPGHSENAFKSGAEIYIASVAKSAVGVERAIQTLSEIAKKYSMLVMMSNCIGKSDNFVSAGKSSIWNKQGSLLAQLDDSNEGILILDTDSRKIIENLYTN
jgi:predicted amidohydrolase